MYKINDQQIEFILNDIRRNGIEIEDLQLNLLDHICCIIEQNLDENGDFEQYYFSVVKNFYRHELQEIEEETIALLMFKNYYAMKKTMIASGIISASVLTTGVILKFLHLPGAAFGIVIGIGLFSIVFLPLMFMLKIKEKQKTKDKVLLGLGSLVAIIISVSILFKLMHWPYANMMGLTSLGILMLLYLPVNLITGIRNADTRVNTIVSSVLLVAGCGLFLSLARSPQGTKIQHIKNTGYFIQNDQLVKNEMLQFQKESSDHSSIETINQGRKIIALVQELKSFLLEKETGYSELDTSFVSKGIWLEETLVEVYFSPDSESDKKNHNLIKNIKEYNSLVTVESNPHLLIIPGFVLLSEEGNEKVLDVLNSMVQIQLFILQNERNIKAKI